METKTRPLQKPTRIYHLRWKRWNGCTSRNLNYEKYEFEGKGGIDSLTAKDLRHLADNFVYFGKYKVIDSLDIVEHHIESGNFQNMCGTIAK